MIITNTKQGWPSKVNFIDSNDVFVGYETSRECCEDAGYYIKKVITPYVYNKSFEILYDLNGYTFDIKFFTTVYSNDLEEGSCVVFRLIKEGSYDLYLHLYNAHNGHYSHGFTAKVGGEVWVEDYL